MIEENISRRSDEPSNRVPCNDDNEKDIIVDK